MFRSESLTVAPIRAESPVIGLRAHFDASLGPARLRYQVDVGLGDALFPAAGTVASGSLLGLPATTVRAYTPYSTIAEKLEAVVVFGLANSRIKDYYDLGLLPRSLSFEGNLLVESLRRTFARRQTPFPEGMPEGLSEQFTRSPLHASRWTGFLEQSKLLVQERPDLESIVREIRAFVLPALQAARRAQSFHSDWSPGGPWRASDDAASR